MYEFVFHIVHMFLNNKLLAYKVNALHSDRTQKSSASMGARLLSLDPCRT